MYYSTESTGYFNDSYLDLQWITPFFLLLFFSLSSRRLQCLVLLLLKCDRCNLSKQGNFCCPDELAHVPTSNNKRKRKEVNQQQPKKEHLWVRDVKCILRTDSVAAWVTVVVVDKHREWHSDTGAIDGVTSNSSRCIPSHPVILCVNGYPRTRYTFSS